MKLFQSREGKFLQNINAITFMAQERAHVEEAWPGDIIGLPNHGNIQIGDTFTIEAGCNRLKETCQMKFDNFYNFRGFPDIPGMDSIMNYGSRASKIS